MPDGIEHGDLATLQRALSQLYGPLLTKFKGRTTHAVAVAIQGVIKPYKPQHKPVIWPSDQARKAYFAMRRKASLPMKYTRGSDPMSQRVQQSWTIRRRATSATLGNRATYAPYVASEEFQTEQHAATGFVTDAQAAEQVIEGGAMQRIIKAQLDAVVQEAFRGL